MNRLKAFALVLFLMLSLAVAPLTSTAQPAAKLTTVGHRDKQEDTVYITNTGKRCHRGDCQYLSKSKIAIKRKDAEARGYTPCKVRRP